MCLTNGLCRSPNSKGTVEKRYNKEIQMVIDEVKNYAKCEKKNNQNKTYAEALLGEAKTPHAQKNEIPFTKPLS